MDKLPQECISNVLSRTTPFDAIRLSVVSKTFLSAANSDDVWDHFLPSDIDSIISQYSQYSPSLAKASTKKAIYFALSHPPIIFDYDQQGFQLDRKTGKKCLMLAARALTIVFDDDERCWRWVDVISSRFPEVAALRRVYWLEIRGIIDIKDLSPNTQYTSYLVYKLSNKARGFTNRPVESSIGKGGRKVTNTLYLDPNVRKMRRKKRRTEVVRPQLPTVRRDGWMEIEIGEFFTSGLRDTEIVMNVMETNGSNMMKGLFVEGIEIRPK